MRSIEAPKFPKLKRFLAPAVAVTVVGISALACEAARQHGLTVTTKGPDPAAGYWGHLGVSQEIGNTVLYAGGQLDSYITSVAFLAETTNSQGFTRNGVVFDINWPEKCVVVITFPDAWERGKCLPRS